MTFTRIYNHWLNPLGNYREPYPYPAKREKQARESWLGRAFGVPGMYIWWHIRNPFNNFTHNWIGIVPILQYGGDRSEVVAERREDVWLSPETNGWGRFQAPWGAYWKKRWITLPYREFFGGFLQIGWRSRGSFNLKLDWDVIKEKFNG